LTKESQIPLLREARAWRFLKAIAVTVGAVFLVIVLAILWAFQNGAAVEFVRKEMLRNLRERCDVQAEFRELSISAFPPELHLADLHLRHLDGKEILAVEEALVRVRILPLFYRRLQLSRVAVLGPQARIDIQNGRVLNMPKCVVRDGANGWSKKSLTATTTTSTMAHGAKNLVFGIRELTVERGQFTLDIDGRFYARLADIGVALVPGRSGGDDLAIGVDHGLLRVADKERQLHRFRLLGHVEGLLTEPRALVVDHLEIDIDEVNGIVTGSIDLLGPVYEARGEIQAPLSVMQEFVAIHPVSGDVVMGISVSGSDSEISAAGKLTVENGIIGDFGLAEKAEIEFRADRKKVRLDAVEVDLGAGKVFAKGQIDLEGHPTMKLEVRTEKASLARILQNVTVKDGLTDFRATGRARLDGTLSPLKLRGPYDFLIRHLSVYDRPWNSPSLQGSRKARQEARILYVSSGRSSGTWTYSDFDLRFDNATITSSGTVGNVEAVVDFRKAGGLTLDASFERFRLDTISPIGGVEVHGQGPLDVSIRGPYDNLYGHGTLKLENALVDRYALGRVRARVDWRDSTRLDFGSVAGQIGRSRYQGNVSVNLGVHSSISIGGQFEPGRIEDVMEVFQLRPRDWGNPNGELVAFVELSGDVRSLTGPVQLEMGEFEVVGESFTKGRAIGRLERGTLIVDSFEADKGQGRLAGNGSIDSKDDRLSLDVRTKGLRLKDLNAIQRALPHLDAPVRFVVRADGALSSPTATVSVDTETLIVGDRTFPPARVSATLSEGIWSISGDAFGDGLSVRARATHLGSREFEGRLAWKKFNAPAFVGALTQRTSWEGTNSGFAEISGSMGNWRNASGKVVFSDGEFQTPWFALKVEEKSELTIARGQIVAKDLRLLGPSTRLTVSGFVGWTQIDLRLKGKLDLAFLGQWSDLVERSGGSMSLDGRLLGQGDTQSLLGTSQVRDGFIQTTISGSRFSDIDADLSFSKASVAVERIDSRWAGGSVSARGNLNLRNWRPVAVSLQGSVDGARPQFALSQATLEGSLSGPFQLEGPLERLSLRGDLIVGRGRLRPRLKLNDLVALRGGAPVYDPNREFLSYDLGFRFDDPIGVRSDNINIDLQGRIRLTGTNQRPGLTGNVSVLQGGRVQLVGAPLRTEAGTIEFTERFRLAPRYDLGFTAQACDAQLRVKIVGTLEGFEGTYTSQPEMPEQDVLSCLTGGIPSQALDDYAATALGGNLLLKFSGVDQQVKKVLPIDQIDVNSEYSSQARSYVPRILVAKELLDGQLRLEYSSSLLDATDQRAAVRWRLTPRLTLQGGWTSSENIPVGDVGLDVRRRWEW
jgi:hypothetical protein